MYVKMVTETDPLNTVLTLLSDNWQKYNTDQKVPKFIRVTDQKKHDYRDTQDLIIAQRQRPFLNEAGLGVDTKHLQERFDLDIRVFGQGQETHYYKVLAEVKRILTANKRNPTTNYHILDFNGDGEDRSDKTYYVFRQIIPIQLFKYNKSWS